METSGNLNRLSNEKVLPFLRFNLGLSFYQNTISRSQGNFSEVREKSGKMKVQKSGHPV